jgi:hypothetical protein
MVRTLPTTTKALLPIMAVSSLLTISQEGDPPTLRELFQRLTVPTAIALTERGKTDQSSRSAPHRRAPSRARIDASAASCTKTSADTFDAAVRNGANL